MGTANSDITQTTLLELCASLSHVIDAQSLSMDAGVSMAHAGDWSEAPRHCPRLVIFPRSPEQDVRKALQASNHAYVLENGRVVIEGGAAEVASDRRVQSAYFGL